MNVWGGVGFFVDMKGGGRVSGRCWRGERKEREGRCWGGW